MYTKLTLKNNIKDWRVVDYKTIVNGFKYSSMHNYGTLNESNYKDAIQKLNTLRLMPDGAKWDLSCVETNKIEMTIQKVSKDLFIVYQY